MRIKNNFKYLLILSLSLTVLGLEPISIKQNSFVIKPAIAQELEGNQNAIDESAKNKLIDKINKLKQFNQKFQSIKPELINELDRAIANKKPTNTVVFAKAIENLESLEKVIGEIENSNLESIRTSSNSVATTVKEIKKVILPFANQSVDTQTKNNENIVAIQTIVNPVTPPDGQLGNDTKNDISNFLNEQTKILLQQVGDLQSQINSLPTTKPSQETSPQTTIDSRIEQLESTTKQFEQENNFFKKFIGILSIFTIVNLLALLRIIRLIDNHKKENKKLIDNIDRNFHQIVNNLQQQINNSRKTHRSSQTSHQNYRIPNTFERPKQYNDEPSYDSGYDNDRNIYSSDSQIDSLHDLETETENISQNYDNKPVVPVKTYPETQLVKSYNNKSLTQKGTKVAITKSSLEQDRLGSNQAVVLSKVRNGDFFVLRDGGFEYLFPGEKLKVNQFNLATVEKLFICNGYETSRSNEFKLVKAAIVSSRSQGTEWVLREQGELNFI